MELGLTAGVGNLAETTRLIEAKADLDFQDSEVICQSSHFLEVCVCVAA